jgi:methylated-DNA-[protein]-cysteine S-methyltransferase
VTTYLLLAKALNSSPRAVGQALKNNPFAPEVPCHRVVASDGSLGGFMGKTKGVEMDKKVRLLASEGVAVQENEVKNFSETLFAELKPA